MATATVSSAGPRYAPPDPTLPKPWRGLVDGKTGYLYFWNPETNVTQYEKPTSPDVVAKSPSMPSSSSVQVQKSSDEYSKRSPAKEDDKPSKHSSDVSRSVQSARSVEVPSQAAATGTTGGSVEFPFQAALTGTTGGSVEVPSHAAPTGTAGRSSLSAEAYRRKHEITVTGVNVPPPFTSFQGTGFPAEILREVLNAGFSAPTPIQAQSWPITLQSRDIVAVAKTGSGKTLGYLMPGFIHLKKVRNNPQMGPTVLVLSPTRELATQIQDETVKFGKSSRIACACLYGGAPKGPQLREIEKGVDIVVATPGRLNDILEMRKISLHQVSYLVLDEADRMLDMGFEPQIRKIVQAVPSRRQTLMFTATWPKEVRKIASDLLNKPVQVNIGNVDELVANKSITQHVEVLGSTDKHRRLEQILRSQEPGSKIIVFCSTKRMCDQLAHNITRQFKAAAIHGDKSQSERDSVLSEFRSGRTPVLVATDVAARGLDVKDIRVVINYDFPTGVEDYVHRIGRTGRAGASGLAYTFFGDQDARHASDLIKILQGANQKVPQEIREMASRSGGMSRGPRRWSSDSGGQDGGYGGRGSDSGYGGRGSDSGYGGSGGGRSSWSSSMSSNAGRGFGQESNERARSRSPDRFAKTADGERPAGLSFHELMMMKRG